jgi:[acyl-carrier-protein] S-malonyltransferase
MISTAILCSGQGAQSAAMFGLLADAPEAESVFLAARRALSGEDPRDIVHQASSEAIHLDKAGQILCCTQAMAAWAVIGSLLARPLLVAGYSVGELAAWGVAGLMDASGVLDLAVQRAEAMDKATTEPSGLVAIRGLTQTALLPICKSHGAYVAIINASDQCLVGGTQASLAHVVVDAIAAGAVRTTMLPVAVASHTPLLAAASMMFRQKLMGAPMLSTVPAGIRLLSGIDGAAVFNVSSGCAACQIQQTVDWAACIDSCRAAGVTKIIELGPGSALAHLVHEAMPYADVHSLSEFHSLAGFVQWATNESHAATAR